MRDSEILQAKTAALLLSGMRDDPRPWPIVRCPASYEAVQVERDGEKA